MEKQKLIRYLTMATGILDDMLFRFQCVKILSVKMKVDNPCLNQNIRKEKG